MPPGISRPFECSVVIPCMQTASGIALACIVLAGVFLGTIIVIKAAEDPTPEPESVKPWPVAYTVPPSYYQNDTAPAPPVMNSTKPAETTLTNKSVDTPPEIIIPELVIRIETADGTGTTTVHVDAGTGGSNDGAKDGANSNGQGNSTAQSANDTNETGRAEAEPTPPPKPTKTPRSVGAAPDGAIRIPQDKTLDELYSEAASGAAYGLLVQADIIIESDTRAEVIGAEEGWLFEDSITLRGIEGVAVVNDIVRITGQVIGISRDHFSDTMIHVLHTTEIP